MDNFIVSARNTDPATFDMVVGQKLNYEYSEKCHQKQASCTGLFILWTEEVGKQPVQGFLPKP